MLNRREFATVLAGGMASTITHAAEKPSIIDTHTHFYDPKRPEGVDWPGKDDKSLYRSVLPPEFVTLTKPYGVSGTVVVEASPRLADNDWLLDLADAHPIIVGVVGRLAPADPKFGEHLSRLAKRKLYRGFRINNAELKEVMKDPKILNKFSLMIDAGLTLDINGGPDVLPIVLAAAKQFPKLKIVLNHIGNVRIDGKTIPVAWKDDIAKLAHHPMVTCKLSALVEGTGKSDGTAPKDVEYYRPTIDVVWKAFGEDRLVFGSNWPVADRFASYGTVFGIVDEYLKGKPAGARAKVLSGNAIKAYGVNIKV
ncbi:amidohydrolase family protein [Zavarzinella formosa]|uniref:amidohydrolase family protein n=1 Tax=Zavarzinella formosa TaxID=360055 RepID=UPI0002D4947D|nr:amidohydrolase family protein [Zavarzinella formosa]